MIISNTDDGNRLPPERRRKQAAKKIAATRKDNRAAKVERVNEAGSATPAEEAASPATAYEPLLDALLIPPPKRRYGHYPNRASSQRLRAFQRKLLDRYTPQRRRGHTMQCITRRCMRSGLRRVRLSRRIGRLKPAESPDLSIVIQMAVRPPSTASFAP